MICWAAELKEEIFIRERRFLLCVCPAHAKKYLNVNRICESVKNRHQRHTLKHTNTYTHTHIIHTFRGKEAISPKDFRPEMVFIYRTVLYFIALNTRRSRTHEMITWYVYRASEMTIISSGRRSVRN